jgi:carbamoyltransferase
MVILGINEDHNSAAALIKDGEILYAASEERISRRKNDVGYPFETIAEAFKETGIKPEEVDFIAYAGNHTDPVQMKIKKITGFKIHDYIREMHEYWKPVLLENKTSSFWEDVMKEERFKVLEKRGYDFGFMETEPKEKWDEVFNKERINAAVRQIGISPEKVLFINHHLCHASYAYYASLLDRSKKIGVITADGWGDGENASVYIAENGKLKKIHGTAMCNLARVYRYITLLLGMRPFEHEYKVMGLAPYAKDYISKPAYEIFKETLITDGIDFKWNKKPSDMYFYFKDKLEGVRFDGIAGGLQRWMEEVIVEWAKNILRHLQINSLVYSGGLAMNVKANKSLGEIFELNDFFVPASGGDESNAIGAAFALSAEKGAVPKTLNNVYLGYGITNNEIKKLIEKYGIADKYEVVYDASNKQVADLLVKNKVVARCVGRGEFGARALGNRSILCHPSNFDNIRLINDKIKYRDFWMPFTPSILDYRAKDYLVNPKGLKSPFMTLAFDTTPLGRVHLKAAIHPADFTARPQILEKETNAEYYELIQEFEKATGVGALLNTSFNLHGEPIVRNAEDAWHTFTVSDLDALLLNETLIIKKSV